MGLLSQGTPLGWEASKQYHAYVKEHGVAQFLHLWRALRERPDDEFKWGDEVEYMVLRVDSEARTTRLSLRADEIIGALNESAAAVRAAAGGRPFQAAFLPEYANYMVEATPGEPYLNTSADLRLVELNMRLRRQMIEKALRPGERVLSLGSFPRLGVGRYSDPEVRTGGPVTESRYIGDGLISPHPRFATLTRNIRLRRGSRVDIRVPLFQDERTAEAAEAERRAAEPSGGLPYDPAREVHMDAMAFGMGSACLQVTFQARNVGEARRLYDHLAVLSPLLLALTASTPFYRGRVSDNDVRWTVISQSVDDRTPEERGSGPGAINKSRYDSIDTYLGGAGGADDRLRPEYNDLDLVYDEQTRARLVEGGVDELLARHVAHLFIRDPLALYGELIELDDEKSSDHFENIQSTNWQTVRFKPPPPGADIGWRVEFRTMEVQVTDFGNAAFTVLIALLSRAILYFDLNLYIPISRVDANMDRAHCRDAARGQRFFFRSVIQGCPPDAGAAGAAAVEDEYEEMTLDEIMHGKAPGFPGLLPVVRRYLEAIGADAATMETVGRYLDFVGDRAAGRLSTPAQWFRNFVRSHPSYERDSRVGEDVQHDLLDACHRVANGTLRAASLMGAYPHASPQPAAAAAGGAVPLQGAGCFELNLADPNKKPCEAIKELLHRHL